MADPAEPPRKATTKKMLYVGGIDDAVTEQVLHAAFVPFGAVAEVNIPKDTATSKPRGFAFVRFEELEDADAAVDNMDGAELYGRVLRVNVAKDSATHKLGAPKAVWSTDEYFSAKDKAAEGAAVDDFSAAPAAGADSNIFGEHAGVK